MFPLVKWSPTRELSSIQREMDDIFNRLFGRAERWMPAFTGVYPTIDLAKKGDNLVVHCDLPGIDPKDVDITVTGNLLTIRGERKHEKEIKEEDYFMKEIGTGVFERSITLPVDINADNIKAHYRNGILEVLLPVQETLKGRKVEVTTEETKQLKAA